MTDALVSISKRYLLCIRLLLAQSSANIPYPPLFDMPVLTSIFLRITSRIGESTLLDRGTGLTQYWMVNTVRSIWCTYSVGDLYQNVRQTVVLWSYDKYFSCCTSPYRQSCQPVLFDWHVPKCAMVCTREIQTPSTLLATSSYSLYAMHETYMSLRSNV